MGTRIGDVVVDLSALAEAGLFPSVADAHIVFSKSTLNAFMAKGRPYWRQVRSRLQQLLSADYAVLRDNSALRSKALLPAEEVKMHLPADIGDYTDFYASKEHATNVGIMFRYDFTYHCM